MTIYLLLMTIILYLGFRYNVNNGRQIKKLYIIVAFSMLALVAALRSYHVGIDTAQFYRAYSIIGKLDWSQSSSVRYEFGFFALCKLLNYISSDPQLLVVVTSIFVCFSVGRFIYRHSENVVFSTYLYIAFNTYAMHLNVMRQAIAVAIILLGIDFLTSNRSKDTLKYCLIVLAASQFHISALVALLPLFLRKIKYNDKTLIIVCAVSICTFAVLPTIVNITAIVLPIVGKYMLSKFGQSNYFAAVINLSICFLVLLYGLFFCKARKFAVIRGIPVPVEKQIDFGLTAYMLSLNFLFLTLAVRMTFMGRLSQYFTIFYITWIPNITRSISDKRSRIIAGLLIFLLTMGYFVIVAVFRPEWYGVVPYEFFWNA